MRVKESSYIKANKPLFVKLKDELNKAFDYASVLVQDSVGKNLSCQKAGTSISEGELLTKRGYVVKVYDGGCFAEYSDNDISEEKIEMIAKLVKERLVKVGEGMSKSNYKVPTDEPMTLNKSTEYEIDPVETGDKAIVEKLDKLCKEGLGKDKRVLNCNVVCTYQKYSKLFLSRNRDMEQNVLWTTGYIIVNAKKGEKVERSMKGFSNLGGLEVLDTMESELDDAVKVAIELLDSTPITPGEYDCICSPETTGMIVHEAFGHGVEMDMFVKDRALAKNFIGEYVASPLVTMHDGNAVNEVATYFFDDEGTIAGDTIIIDKGKLVTGISDLQSAMALGTKPTGNGKREGFNRKAYTRMTNTYFEAGTDKVEDMIASVKNGFLLESPSSGMEDPKNWGIQCMVSIAREIKDGKLTGKIFSPVVLTGYVPDLLKSISMMSDKIELGGTGYCGKGYKELVKVSDGGPYIKARIRLG